jgi:hypothetical protein
METYYERHKEELKAKRKEYYRANREKEIERRRLYSAAHREERREYDRAYRARKKTLGGENGLSVSQTDQTYDKNVRLSILPSGAPECSGVRCDGEDHQDQERNGIPDSNSKNSV